MSKITNYALTQSGTGCFSYTEIVDLVLNGFILRFAFEDWCSKESRFFPFYCDEVFE